MNRAEVSGLRSCEGFVKWTRSSFCPKAGPALSQPGHHGDKKRKGQRAIRNSVPGSGQQCEEAGLQREGRRTRILSDKNHQGLLISEGLILGYRVSCWVDEQNDMAGTNKRSPWRSSGAKHIYTGKTSIVHTHTHTRTHNLLSSRFHTLTC